MTDPNAFPHAGIASEAEAKRLIERYLNSMPAEKLILRGEIFFCLDCGAPLESQDQDDDGRPICWITHKPDCRDARA